MPLIKNSALPTLLLLEKMGQTVLPIDGAVEHVRELHIGLLNMMPDAAFQVTELQFLRLINNSSHPVLIHVHPFTIDGLPRSAKAREYISEFYHSFNSIRDIELDALIVTGANVENPAITQEPFWPYLKEVVQWTQESVPSTVCSCLATHAFVQEFYGITRVSLPAKRWGVYQHRIQKESPLLHGLDNHFFVPHSRYNAITREHFTQAGLEVLVDSEEGGVHLAVSEDGLKYIYFQAHPEYDANSLLKEYKRESLRFQKGERADYPPVPENYLSEEAHGIAESYRQRVLKARSEQIAYPSFPERELEPFLQNIWEEAGQVVFHNWLNLLSVTDDTDKS